MAWDILEIDRSSKTAAAQRGRAEKDGYEIYEENRLHYLMRRAKQDEAPPAVEVPAEEPTAEEPAEQSGSEAKEK